MALPCVCVRSAKDKAFQETRERPPKNKEVSIAQAGKDVDKKNSQNPNAAIAKRREAKA